MLKLVAQGEKLNAGIISIIKDWAGYCGSSQCIGEGNCGRPSYNDDVMHTSYCEWRDSDS